MPSDFTVTNIYDSGARNIGRDGGLREKKGGRKEGEEGERGRRRRG